MELLKLSVLAMLRRAALLAILLAVFQAPAVHATTLGESRLKAEFLRSFIEFTYWPGERPRLSVCLFGQGDAGAAFASLNGYRVRNSVLVLRRSEWPEAIDECDVIYLPLAEQGRLDQVLARVRGRPVLVVADSEGAAQLGATVSLHSVADGRLGFDANFTAAKAMGLKLSSRLLQLARRVH